MRGQTQEDIGMIFDSRVQVLPQQSSRNSKKPSCTHSGSLLVPSNGQTEVTFIFAAGTDYDEMKGTAASNYTFKGLDPEAAVLSTIKAASKRDYQNLYNAHVQDHSKLFGQFSLNLPDPDSSVSIPTAELMAQYTYEVGNPYVESLIFDYGRYLFIASSRPGSLPPNLQGIWTESLTPAWSADYHVDINLQM